MSTATLSPSKLPLVDLLTAPEDTSERLRVHWTRETFQRLGEIEGLFGTQKYELLAGDIYILPPANPLHSSMVNPTGDRLKETFGTGHIIRTEQPIAITEDSQPEPDVAVCIGTSVTYRERFPVPEDIRLLIEISDSTLRIDRTIKTMLYAQAGIREYWILNLRENQLEVYRDPSENGYRSVRVYLPNETITPLFAPDASLSIRDLLGGDSE